MGQLRGSDFAASAITGTLRARRAISRQSSRCCRRPGWSRSSRISSPGSIRANADVEGTVRQPILQLVVESDEAGGGRTEDRQRAGSRPARGLRIRSRGTCRRLSLPKCGWSGQARFVWRVNTISRIRPIPALSTRARGASIRRPTFRCRAWSIWTSPVRGAAEMVFGKASARLQLDGVTGHSVWRDRRRRGSAEGDRANIAGSCAGVQCRGRRKRCHAGRTVSGVTTHEHSGARPRTCRERPRVAGVHRWNGGHWSGGGGANLEQWRDGRASLEVTALDGHVQTLPVALREPARARYEGGRLLLDRLEGTLGKTSLSAAGACPSRVHRQRAVPRALRGAMLFSRHSPVTCMTLLWRPLSRRTRQARHPSRQSLRVRALWFCLLASAVRRSLPLMPPTSSWARAWFRRDRTSHRLRTFRCAHISRMVCSSCAISTGRYHGANVTATGRRRWQF